MPFPSPGDLPLNEAVKLSHQCTFKDLQTALEVKGFPCGSAGKESACIEGDLGSIPGLGRSPGEGKGYPLQHPGLDYTVHGVTKSQTLLSDFHFHFLS